ncbi:alpha/beta hydrolase [Gordonia sp. DT219]|uniref:alpha/beta hydrolase n=1 Tax=Gordonia sp. DT219 TaxID=3416658 RepID=UPI003CF43185
MRLTISDVRSWRTGDITTAGDAAGTAAGLLEQALDVALGSALRPTDWHGRTHDAALTRIRHEHDHANEVRNVLQQIADEAGDAGIDLGQACHVVKRAVEDAVALGCVVADDGSVTHPHAANLEMANGHQILIQQGLRAVDEVDELYGARIEDLRSDLASMICRQPDVTVPGLGTMEPDAMVRRLQGLSVQQRRSALAGTADADLRRLVQADPETMGNLDGVPFSLRSTANEINIRNALADEIRRNGTKSERATMLRSFLEQRPAPYPGVPGAARNDPLYAETERVFISFTDADNPRLVEMVGALTPVTANATVYVPGTGTNARGYGGDNWKAAWNLADRTDGPVFIYLDGDLPQKLVDSGQVVESFGDMLNPFDGNIIEAAPTTFDDTALDPHYAKEMAPRLVGFGRALDAEIAAVSPDATTTYIGHSYGGAVVAAAEAHGLRADNIIHASSAGVGVVPPSGSDPDVHRYTLTAPGDPIQMLRMFPFNPHGFSPDLVPGFENLPTGRASDGSWLLGPAAHGSYFNDPDSDAFGAIVDVITGAHQARHLHPDTSIKDVLDALARARDLATPHVGPAPPLPHDAPGTVNPPALPDIPLNLW